MRARSCTFFTSWFNLSAFRDLCVAVLYLRGAVVSTSCPNWTAPTALLMRLDGGFADDRRSSTSWMPAAGLRGGGHVLRRHPLSGPHVGPRPPRRDQGRVAARRVHGLQIDRTSCCRGRFQDSAPAPDRPRVNERPSAGRARTRLWTAPLPSGTFVTDQFSPGSISSNAGSAATSRANRSHRRAGVGCLDAAFDSGGYTSVASLDQINRVVEDLEGLHNLSNSPVAPRPLACGPPRNNSAQASQ